MSLRFAASLGLAGLALVAGSALADPAGTFAVSGVNPNGTRYEGALVSTPEGGVYRVEWRIGDAAFSGIGLHDGRSFAVAYYGGFTGVVSYVETRPGVWEGRWAVLGETGTGTETLVRTGG